MSATEKKYVTLNDKEVANARSIFARSFEQDLEGLFKENFKLQTTFRKDMFGNLIEKGKKKHKIMFRDNLSRENDPMLPKVEMQETPLVSPASKVPRFLTHRKDRKAVSWVEP